MCVGPNRKLLPNYYCLRHGRSDSSNVLRNWTLQARVSDKSEWVTIRWHVDDLGLAAKGYSVSFWPISMSVDKKKEKKVKKQDSTTLTRANNKTDPLRRGLRRQSTKNLTSKETNSNNDDNSAVGDKDKDSDEKALPPKPVIAKRSQALKRSGMGDRSSWIVALRMLSEAAAAAASTGILKPYKNTTTTATTATGEGSPGDSNLSGVGSSSEAVKTQRKRPSNDLFVSELDVLYHSYQSINVLS